MGMGRRTKTVDPRNGGNHSYDYVYGGSDEACRIRMYILPCYLNKYENYINASKSTHNMQCNLIFHSQQVQNPRIV